LEDGEQDAGVFGAPAAHLFARGELPIGKSAKRGFCSILVYRVPGLKRLMLPNTAVPKTVPRKYETGETCEIGEIFQYVFSTTCVFSIG
jgi:hypothetical protein